MNKKKNNNHSNKAKTSQKLHNEKEPWLENQENHEPTKKVKQENLTL